MKTFRLHITENFVYIIMNSINLAGTHSDGANVPKQKNSKKRIKSESALNLKRRSKACTNTKPEKKLRKALVSQEEVYKVYRAKIDENQNRIMELQERIKKLLTSLTERKSQRVKQLIASQQLICQLNKEILYTTTLYLFYFMISNKLKSANGKMPLKMKIV